MYGERRKMVMVDLLSFPISILLLMAQFWALYQVSILTVGLKSFSLSHKELREDRESSMESLPMVSIIIPAKNEEKVIERAFKALLRLDYPSEKMRIIVVEDGSTDKTAEICAKYAELYPDRVIFLHRLVSNGKPSALNYALNYAKGEIIAIFDADSVPEPNVLKRAITYFVDPTVAAVQGKLCYINADENILTKSASLEELIWFDVYLRGKDALGLFIYLRGSCLFIRKNILSELGGFDETALSEDLELSVRLTMRGYRIRYAPCICSWQETPSQITQFFKQRTRWFRGTMQVALKYKWVIFKPMGRSIDVWLTLFSPLTLIICPPCYIITFYFLFTNTILGPFMWLLAFFTIVTSLMFIFCGSVLAYIFRPKRIDNLLWLLLAYLYWGIEMFIALYAALLTLLRRPYKWVKTEKTGNIKVTYLYDQKTK